MKIVYKKKTKKKATIYLEINYLRVKKIYQIHLYLKEVLIYNMEVFVQMKEKVKNLKVMKEQKIKVMIM